MITQLFQNNFFAQSKGQPYLQSSNIDKQNKQQQKLKEQIENKENDFNHENISNNISIPIQKNKQLYPKFIKKQNNKLIKINCITVNNQNNINNSNLINNLSQHIKATINSNRCNSPYMKINDQKSLLQKLNLCRSKTQRNYELKRVNVSKSPYMKLASLNSNKNLSQNSKQENIFKLQNRSKSPIIKKKLENYYNQNSYMLELEKLNKKSPVKQQKQLNFFQNLEKSLNKKKFSLHQACIVGNLEYVKYCNFKLQDLNEKNENHDTPLHLASQNGHLNIVQQLIQNGCQINQQNKQLNTALHLACQNNQSSIIQLLLSQKNIEKNIKNSKKQQPIQLISHFKLIKFFNLQKKDILQDFRQNIQKCKISLQDFEIQGLIGRGSFGEVFLVNFNQQEFALKVIEKNKVFKQNLQKYVKTERNVLSQTKHPFIIKLYYAFQTSDKLFLVLQYASQGDLGKILEKNKKFTEKQSKLYLAEIILGLENLHDRDIIYRDLKPENIVLGSDGHVLLTDFGLSKEGVMDPYKGGQSFCGSAYYLAPEMLSKKGHGKAIDWYTLGVVFYEMVTGRLPFNGQTQEQIFEMIKNGKFIVPKDVSSDCKSLITGLMEKNPDLRLGAQGAFQVKNHQFFKDVDWDVVQIQMPIFTNSQKVKRFYNQIEINNNEDCKNIKGWSFSYEK